MNRKFDHVEEAIEQAAQMVEKETESRLYNDAVEWIALNDNSGSDDDASDIAMYVTTKLVADTFEKHEKVVAKDVLRVRLEWLAIEANNEKGGAK